jgi:hypothetical protein
MDYVQLMPGRTFRPWHSLMYYAQRAVTPRPLRRAVANGVAGYLRIRHGMPHLDNAAGKDDTASLQALRADGFAMLPRLLGREQIDDIHAYLRNRPLSPHGRSRLMFLADAPPPEVRMAEYSLADVLGCPHLLELANSAPLIRLAAHYIGCKPTISAIGLRWSYPQEGTGTGLQGFHRDCDDWRFIKVFAYLTDVDEGAGPHVYVSGSHRERCGVRLAPYTDEEVAARYGQQKMVSVTGPAGTLFAVDTHGVHKGLLPSSKPRLLLQIQYSLLPVYMYDYAPAAGLQTTKIDHYINRLLLKRPKP